MRGIGRKPGHQPVKVAAKPLPQRLPKPTRVVKTPEATPVKEAVVGKKPVASSVEPTLVGVFELSPLMSKMLEDELQDIMIRVWQELPDNPTGSAEKQVVDTFRNDAGDNLRNVLGLNVTKRLLNVHNPLYVKVHFSGKPEKAHLSAFLKKYNFNAFKRVESAVNTFAAQVRTVMDFDRICEAGDIRCGNIKVTVTPCYKFTKCPINLKTPYNDDDDDAVDKPDMESEVKQEIEEEKQSKNDEKSKSNTKTELLKETKALINTKEEPTIAKKKNEDKTAKDIKKTKSNTETELPKETKAVNDTKEKPKIVNQKNEDKTAEEIKIVQIKKPVDKVIEHTEDKAVKAENKTVGKKIVAAVKVNQTVSNVVKKSENTSTIKQSTVSVKKVPQTKPQEKQVKPNVTPKIKPATVNTTPIKTTKKIKETSLVLPKHTKSDKTESDFDELDDHDILALMSEGIILDECSGSDVE